MLHVREVSRQLNLNPQTLYFYERIGLIPPPQRTESGYRLFSPQDVDRLSFIVQAKSLGLSLDDIKDILLLKDRQSLTCQVVYERLQQKTKDIQDTIRRLQTLHDSLVPLLDQCQNNFNHPDEKHQCTVLEQETKNSAVVMPS